MSDDGLVSDRANLCEARIFLDFKSPALVVCEMPVKGVKLMNLHDIEISFHFFHCKEVT